MSTYFTSDPHFYHKNIIKYCNRPWQTVEDMNRGLVSNFNSVVGHNDTTYIIGDFAFGSRSMTASMLKKLNGKIILVQGNHDGSVARCTELGFTNVIPFNKPIVIEDSGYALLLNHVPLHHSEWDAKSGGREIDYHLAGHVHTEWTRLNVEHGDRTYTTFNVGVDVRDYRPVTIEQLLSWPK